MKKRAAIYSLITILLSSVFMANVYAADLHFQKTIASADGRAYAIRSDGSLYYWGDATYNDDTKDQSSEQSTPINLLDNVISVYGNWWGGFAIKSDNSLWSIGAGGNIEGAYKESTDSPVKVMDGIIEAANAYSTYLVLKTDGTVWVWGFNAYNNPVKVMDNVKQISAGIDSFYVLKTDGTLWGWGDNYSGQLGVKTKDTYLYWWSAVKIMDRVAYVHGAGQNAFAIKSDGSLYGWGDDNGILMNMGVDETHQFKYPDGSRSDVEAVFTPVKLMDDVIKVDGRNHIAAIKVDKSLWTWGSNSDGELGYGTTNSSSTPQKISDNVEDVAAENGFTLVLKEDGTLWGCGTNSSGELGIGDIDYDPHPDLIKIMDNVALPNSVLSIPSSWAKEEVDSAIQMDLVPSDLQSLYEKDITRGEFVELISILISKLTGKNLHDLVTETEQAIVVNFTDTTDEDILDIARLGIVKGISSEQFNPLGTLTREQAAKILKQTVEFLGASLKENSAGFSDDASISPWARDGVYFCNTNGIMSGIGNNNFGPQKSYSREMSILTMLRVYNLLN